MPHARKQSIASPTSACQWSMMGPHPPARRQFSTPFPIITVESSLICPISFARAKVVRLMRRAAIIHGCDCYPTPARWHLLGDHLDDSPLLDKNIIKGTTVKQGRDTEKWLSQSESQQLNLSQARRLYKPCAMIPLDLHFLTSTH